MLQELFQLFNLCLPFVICASESGTLETTVFVFFSLEDPDPQAQSELSEQVARASKHATSATRNISVTFNK